MLQIGFSHRANFTHVKTLSQPTEHLINKKKNNNIINNNNIIK